MASLVQMWEAGGQAAREEQTRKGLAKLMQGDQSALPQVYANDPKSAADAVKFQGDQREAQMGEFAKLSTLYARTRDGNIYGQWARLGKQTGLLPADAPDAITDPADADGSVKFAEAVASAWGGQAGNTVQSRFVGEDGQVYALMRDGQVSPLGIKADPSMQIIEGAGGFYGVNRRNLQANPVQVGQPGVQSQQPVQRAPGEVPFAIDPSLPPEVQASIRADEQQWAAKPEMAIGGPMGGGQLQGKPKEASKDAPSGYQWGSDGASLVPIPGGPADRKNNPTSADLAKGEMGLRKEVSDRLKEPRTVMTMFEKVQAAANDPSASSDLAMIFAFMKMLDPGSVVREQEFANAQNAAGVPDQVRNAWNKARNGERLNPNQRAQFLATAQQMANQASTQITNITREYQGIADQYGWDPQRATGAPDFRNVNSGGQSGKPASDIDALLEMYK